LRPGIVGLKSSASPALDVTLLSAKIKQCVPTLRGLPAQTLALGTMMLRNSVTKALVDASYNRYAWHDLADPPEWFVDDENCHYRPQLPIPPELMAKMKEKMLALSTKPIAKVAEARARKNKRAKNKMETTKKKAEAVANSSEISETMKLKAISKAMRGQCAKTPGKTHVVSFWEEERGVKFVDKQMRNDKKNHRS
jgi:AdoMet-dependent rRNA methyltransferase SPB1